VVSTKVKDTKSPQRSTNEILYWKNKYRELEKEKFRLEEAQNNTIRQLEKECKEHDRLKNQLELMRVHFIHLAPKAVQLFEVEYKEMAANDPRLSEMSTVDHNRRKSAPTDPSSMSVSKRNERNRSSTESLTKKKVTFKPKSPERYSSLKIKQN
jgi:hypothetical protein